MNTEVRGSTRELQNKLRSEVFLREFFDHGMSARAAIDSMVSKGNIPTVSDASKNQLANKYLRENFHNIQLALGDAGLGPDEFCNKIKNYLERWEADDRNSIAIVKLMELWAKSAGWLIDRKLTKDMTNRGGPGESSTAQKVNEKLKAMNAGYSFSDDGEVIIDLDGKFSKSNS